MSRETGTKFLHYRKRAASGAVESRGGLTVAYVDSPDGVRKYALAQCSTEDNFSKARGRELAANRLKTVFARATLADDSVFLDNLSATAAQLGYERKFSGKRKPPVAAKKATKKIAAKAATSKK